jgi:O-acetylhomoserine (thiol)-lyase
VRRFATAQDSCRDVVPSLHTANAYQYESAQLADEAFSLKNVGHVYTRISNPTNSDLEYKLCFLDQGTGALVTSSGHAAHVLAFQTLMDAGDEFIASPDLYGGSVNLFTQTFKDFGWHVVWCDINDRTQLESAITPKTKVIFAETMANPSCRVLDIKMVADVAHQHGIPLMVDNTMPTPYMLSPKKHGADIIVYSLSKYLGGHGNAIGGAIVETGLFPWKDHPRYRRINQPRPEYGDVIFSDIAPEAPFTAACRSIGMRDLGGCISPFNSYLVLMGLQTLHVRMQRHLDNAMHIARFLEKHPKVERVIYAGLESSSHYPLAKKYLRNGAGAVVSFMPKGDRTTAFKVIDNLKLFRHAASFGDTTSMVVHPSTTTHSQLTDDQKGLCGINDQLIRLSVGIEHGLDLMDDLEQALATI